MVSNSHAPALPADPPTFKSPRPPARTRLDRLVPGFLRSHAGEVNKSRANRTRTDWVVDLIAFSFAIALGVAIHVDATHNGPGRPSDLLLTIDMLLLPVAAVLLFWRRRWPYAVAVTIAVLSIVGQSTGAAWLIAIYALAAYGAQGRAFLGLGIMFATVFISATVWADSGSDGGGYWSDVTFGIIASAAVFAWGLFAGARRALLLTLEDRAARAESEQQLRVDQARQQERTRIAREMHDVLAHRMSLLSVHAGALEFRPDAPPEDVARAAGVIRATAHEALEELRTVIGVMRVADATGVDPAEEAVPEAPQPTLAEVPHLVDEWRAAGARIELSVDAAALQNVPATVSRTAYRIVQESLTNAGKHAPTAKIAVAIGGVPGESLTVSVTNPLGVSTPVSEIPGTGLGLVGLSERTELVGGVFAAGIDSDLRRYVVEARLPWSAAA